jgi:hypothetical protein
VAQLGTAASQTSPRISLIWPKTYGRLVIVQGISVTVAVIAAAISLWHLFDWIQSPHRPG